MSAHELILSFESDRWRARGCGIDLTHRELPGLEELLAARLASEAPVDVRLRFDMAALPRWLHQYQAHYCNYTLRVATRSAGA
jgi:hypothetical protein